jgi:hypothetical protein
VQNHILTRSSCTTVTFQRSKTDLLASTSIFLNKMQTRRHLAMMNALSGEQESILNAFRNLPVHAGVLSGNYQKAAEVENARKKTVHDEELGNLRAEFAGNLERFSANLRQEMNKTITVKIDNLTNEINSLKKTNDETRHVLIRIEEDILVLKTPKKPFPWGELLAVVIMILSVGVMYLYNPSQKLMIGR